MKWEEDDIEFLIACVDAGWAHKDIATELDRNYNSIQNKASRLALVSKNILKKSTEEYKVQLPKNIKVLESYIGAHNKILHKHSCGYIWLVSPSVILSGSNCPECAGVR